MADIRRNQGRVQEGIGGYEEEMAHGAQELTDLSLLHLQHILCHQRDLMIQTALLVLGHVMKLNQRTEF